MTDEIIHYMKNKNITEDIVFYLKCLEPEKEYDKKIVELLKEYATEINNRTHWIGDIMKKNCPRCGRFMGYDKQNKILKCSHCGKEILIK